MGKYFNQYENFDSWFEETGCRVEQISSGGCKWPHSSSQLQRPFFLITYYVDLYTFALIISCFLSSSYLIVYSINDRSHLSNQEGRRSLSWDWSAPLRASAPPAMPMPGSERPRRVSGRALLSVPSLSRKASRKKRCFLWIIWRRRQIINFAMWMRSFRMTTTTSKLHFV